jgi:protein-S-isoprenylcysteine O-methyltransferase Ste14
MINAWTNPATLGLAALWLVFVGYWTVAARRVHPNKQVESQARLIRGALMVLGTALLSPLSFSLFPMSWRLFPWGVPTELVAVCLTAAGIAFAIWARSVLGQFWSGVVTLKEGHRLIRQGPYRFVRNPIYTGILTALLGAAILNGTIWGLLGLAMFVIGFSMKIRVEETLLRTEFGGEYEEYRKQVKALVPFIY